MPKYGVTMEDPEASYIEDQRVRFDDTTGKREILDRTSVVQELVRIGIAANKVIESSGLDLDHGRPREALVRQAVLNELNREDVDDGR